MRPERPPDQGPFVVPLGAGRAEWPTEYQRAIATAFLTCAACPIQIEGQWGELFYYFRARHGHSSLSIGTSVEDAVFGQVLKEWDHDEWEWHEAVGAVWAELYAHRRDDRRLII